jgi:hypothetical protein
LLWTRRLWAGMRARSTRRGRRATPTSLPCRGSRAACDRRRAMVGRGAPSPLDCLPEAHADRSAWSEAGPLSRSAGAFATIVRSEAMSLIGNSATAYPKAPAGECQ